MCPRLHKPLWLVLTILLLVGGGLALPSTAQDVPEPPPEAPVETPAESPPGALDEADQPPELPAAEAPEAPEAPEGPDAPPEPETPRVSHGERVVIFESVTVEKDEVVREVVVIGGSLTILGRVEREAVVVGGPARVEGHVGRELTVVGGSLYLGPESSVGRDITVVGGSLERSETAEVGGAVNNVRLGPFLRNIDWENLGDVDFDFDPRFRWLSYGFGLFWHLMGLALLGLLLCFAYLVAPDAVQRVERKVDAEAGKSALVGFLCLLAALPAALLLVLVTCGLGVLALPFLILAAVVAWLVGYAAVALRIGGYLAGRQGWNAGSPYMLILLGFALVEIWGFLHQLLDVPALWWIAVIFGLAAFVVELAVCVTAFGAAILTWIESRRPPAPYAPASPGPAGPPPETPPPASPPRPEPELRDEPEEPWREESEPGEPPRT